MRQSARWILAVLLLLAGATPAAAEDRAAARELYKEGTRQFDIGDYHAALSAFKKAYLNFEDPGLLFNIAQSYRQLGEKADALRFYRLYLSKLEKAPNREFVQRMIGELEVAIAQDKEAKAHTPPPDQPAPAPAVSPTVAAPAQPLAAAHEDRGTPVYKKWWLWTIVGVVVVGAAVGIGVGVAESGSSAFKTTLPAMGPAASRLQLHVDF